MDGTWDDAAKQVLRALRGSRSQVAFSRRLGYRSNVSADWEVGRRFPSATRTLAAAARLGVDLDGAMARFHPAAAPAWREGGLAAWLVALQGRTPRRDVAARAAASGPQVGRWLRGEADPRLPELLALIEALTGRAGDWVAELVDIDAVPALTRAVRSRREVLDLVWREPWTAAVLAALSACPRVEDVAARLQLALPFVQDLVDILVRGGSVAHTDQGYLVRGLTVDVPPNAEQVSRVRRHWAQVAADRLAAPSEGDRFMFNVMAVSRVDLERIVERQAAFFREIRSIVAASEPPEEVALLVLHTLTWR